MVGHTYLTTSQNDNQGILGGENVSEHECHACLTTCLYDILNWFGGKNAEELVHTDLQVGKKHAVLVDP